LGGKAHGGRRIPWEDGIAIASRIRMVLAGEPGEVSPIDWHELLTGTTEKLGDLERFIVCGSFRRKKPSLGDVDVVVLPKPGMEQIVVARMGRLWGMQKNGKPKHSGLIGDVQVDVSVTTADQWGANVLFLTGSWEHNVVMRRRAMALGLLLNEKGLYKVAVDAKGKRVAGEWVAGRTEDEVFDALGMEFVKPEDREVGEPSEAVQAFVADVRKKEDAGA